MIRLASLPFIGLALTFPLACGSDDFVITPNSDAGAIPSDASTTLDGGGTNADADAATITVSGRVAYFVYNQPAAGATVTIGTRTANTNSMGEFTIPNVSAPYDLRVSYAILGQTYVRAFEGLTRTDPVVELSSYSPNAVFSATINGTVSGPPFPLGANRTIKVLARAQNGGTVTRTIDGAAANGTFTVTTEWRETGTYQAKVFAAYTENDVDGVPTSWQGLGSATVSVTNGATVNNVMLTLADPAEANVASTLTQPSPTAAVRGGIGINFEPGCSVEYSKPISGGFTLSIPTVAGLGAGPFVYASTTADYPLSAGNAFDFKSPVTAATTLAFDTRSPLTPQPASGTAFTPTTEFSWDARGSGAYTVRVLTADFGPVYVVTTRRNAITIPAETAAMAGTYTWRVSHFYGASTVDDLATRGSASGLLPRVTSPNRTFIVP